MEKMTYVMLLVRRGRDDRERCRTRLVKAHSITNALLLAAREVEPGWRIVRVSEGGYH